MCRTADLCAVKVILLLSDISVALLIYAVRMLLKVGLYQGVNTYFINVV